MDVADSSSEKDKLLDKAKGQAETNKPKCRHFLLLPSLFVTVFGGQLCLYVLNEWTQHQISVDYFKDSNTTFSTCDISNSSDPLYIKYKDVQKETAKWLNIYSLCELIPVILVQLYLPSYSDHSGRKFLLVLTTVGLCIKAVGVTVSVYYKAKFWYILIPIVLGGATGSFFALLCASFSFLADLTFSQKHRTTAIVVYEAVLILSSVGAAYLSGYFIETINLGFFNTSLIGTILSGVGLILIILTPESLPRHRRSQRQSFWGTMKRMTDFYISADFTGQRKAYILLLIAFMMAIIANINRSSMETLYFLGQPFCWGPSKIGWYAMIRNASLAIIGFTVPILQRCMADTSIAILSTLSNSVSYIVEAFANTTLAIYMVTVCGMFSFLVVPMIRSLMSSMTPSDKQGALFAGVATIEVVSTLIASLSQNTIYTFTVSFMNGFVFLILAMLSVINLILLCVYRRTRRNETSFGIFIRESEGAIYSSID